MDWSGCDLVEVIPGKVSGVPLVKGTRIPVDFVVESYVAGSSLDQIAECYPSVSIHNLAAVVAFAAERSAWDEKTLVDWKGCALVERVPGRCSGAPTIVGTRIFPDTIAKYYWSGAGVEEMEEDYPSLSRETILELIRWVKMKEVQAA